MRYACSSGHKLLDCGRYCKICYCHFFPAIGKKPIVIDFDESSLISFCNSYLEKHTKEPSTLDRSIPCSAPQHSPILPRSSLRSCNLNCGDFVVDMNSEIREKEDGALDTSQEQPYQSKDNGIRSFYENTKSVGTGEATSTEEIYISRSLTLERHEESNNDKVRSLNSTLEDVRSIRDGDVSDGAENAIDSSGASCLLTIETDPLIWMPPAPVDIEDDMDSVANNDDDDEYSDGTKWVQSSWLNGFDVENGSNVKEERQKAIMDAMNGQFKILVSRFLASEDISVSEGGHDENWRDIVASLSWEAASLIKPEANEGRAMDPLSYVKVKCIATGARSQSEVVKGLVFKKNTPHKHMLTKFKNPRLLLLQGVLGQRDVGFSSFNSMNQENDYLKSINEMIEMCHPNVVLVEKSVSRDMQEFLLAKGMTLVFDMKLTRLNRISRCIGSPVISCADILANPKLKHCELFHIEKFVEEHNSSSDGGKRSCKTLMFLEGFPKPLGCTILLKGAHIDELKKVKRVVQYTLFAAYHLILETSFFADQRASFSDMHELEERNGSSVDKTMVSSYGGDATELNGDATELNTSHIDGYTTGIAEEYSPDIPSSDGSLANSAHDSMHFSADIGSNETSRLPSFNHVHDNDSNPNNLMHDDLFIADRNGAIHLDSSPLSDRPWQLVSSLSVSLKKFLSENFTPVTSESFSSYFGFNEEELDIKTADASPVPTSLETLEDDTEVSNDFIQEKPHEEPYKIGKIESSSSFKESIEQCSADVSNNVETQDKDNIGNVMNPESILVLMSSQCIPKGVVCEQSHLSRIKYYGNFDVSLGRFLQDTLLNKKHSCVSCGEPPEAHVYCYTHQNGNLTVLVKQLPQESSLSGEAEGKIWMWTRCLKCEQQSGIARSTHRVVMSAAARGLSFGKFLELSFSSHSVASRLSSKCGHSLHRDCLRFFGMGSIVAMFRYSAVEIYAACKPPPVLEFHNPNGQEWIKREAKSVLQKGDTLFLEIANLLQKLKHGDSSFPPKQSMNFPSSIKDLSEIEQMLLQEKLEFEASLLRAINFSGQLGKAVSEILSLSWLAQELLFELYIWDRRLHSLLQCRKDTDAHQDQIHEHCLQDIAVPLNRTVQSDSESSILLGSSIQSPMNVEDSSSCNHSPRAQSNSRLGAELEIDSAELSENSADHSSLKSATAGENSIGPRANEHASSFLDQDSSIGESKLSPLLPDGQHQEEADSSLMQGDDCCQAPVEKFRPTEKITESEQKPNNTNTLTENSTFKEHDRSSNVSEDSCMLKLSDSEDWIWAPAAELRRAFRKDLHYGSLHKFEFIYSYTPIYLLTLHQMISQEKGSLHFPVGGDGNVISVHEDEISSIIACALALSENQHSVAENIDEKDASEGKVEADKAIDYSYSLPIDGSVGSYWSSTGSFESEGIHPSRSVSSLSSDELSTSSSEASFFVDRLLASEILHPEISVGMGRSAGKTRCSVVCVHSKQFRDLRKMCCPSELAYISSLSHCKKWDAQGGKSKAFFAKTMDDRLIIKQIKKTEVDSFLKFAPDYFRHITYSINSGSQTCLAKILGIYQVRQNRAGKELKIDLMVMENLLFGRNIVRTYDLKGAVFSRYIADTNDPDKVLLDENFVEDMRKSPMYIGGRAKHLLQRAIWNDTSFLTSINVMDYSLLVGVDKQRGELVFGIIDYLRQFTWDKQLETWVKSSLVVPKNSLPTVISPKEYKKRFRKFMAKYFLTVPDSWSSDQCSGPCKFCSEGVKISPTDCCQSSKITASSNT